MADRVAVMIGGNLLQLATPQAIYDDPAHIEVARFVGQPRINLVPALAENGRRRASAASGWRCRRASCRAPPVTLGIRPEFVALVATAGRTRLAARVERIEFLGSEVIVYCQLDAIGESMIAKLTPAEAAGVAAGNAGGAHLCRRTGRWSSPPDGQRLPQRAVAVDAAGAGAWLASRWHVDPAERRRLRHARSEARTAWLLASPAIVLIAVCSCCCRWSPSSSSASPISSSASASSASSASRTMRIC